tara:strand:- start:7535 stop:8779 length:1245 start_codon:yes stop_codon:yes gene_type:complete
LEPARSGAFDVFSVHQFRWLFAGNVAFFFAMQGQMLTRTLIAWELTGEATSLAYINLVVAIPMIFASLLGGAITDRVERRRLVIVGQSLIVANEVFILALLIAGRLEFWHLLCTAFVAGCAFPFIMPARMAITMKVVGPQRLQSAMAFQSGAMNLNRVMGPAVMGIIIAQSSFTTAYALSVILYGSAVLCMFGIEKSRSSEPGDEKKPLLADIVQGLSYMRQNRPVLICLLFGLLPMFLAMPFQNILVMLAEQAWQAGESGVGILMGTGGVGGVLGAIWIVRRGENASRLKLMLGCTIAFGIFLGLFAQTSNFYVALLPLLAANLCASASQTVNNASMQLLVVDKLRGRMSSFMMLSYGLTPIGVFPMAIVADNIGAANAILGASVILVVLVSLFYLGSSTLRRLDQSVATAMA